MAVSSLYDENETNEQLKRLYPSVNEEETPLPKKWSAKDKYNYINLSEDHMKVQYKGQGKNHRDAASVRATHPIPTTCGVYYFEVEIVSKGRDGYMGIGLSAQGVNLNRLPGWDKMSYGYHGDDGHSFCSSGTGQAYGPTFTTGDIIGCCLNLVDNSCFYTKNGIHIGTAFRDLPTLQLYPTVGLQTPNEELRANFGQEPFVFDFEDYLKEWRASVRNRILNYAVNDDVGRFQTVLHKLVSSYLIHHGYVASTEAFNRHIYQGYNHYEDITSIKNRQKIQKAVLSGRIGEAIEFTEQFFPNLLSKNPNLMFLLKVQQFIEMVNGTESEIKNLSRHPSFSSPAVSPKHMPWSKSSSNSPASSHNGFSPPPQRPQLYKPPDRAYPQQSTSAEPMNTEYFQKSASGSSCGSDSDMETDSDEEKSQNGVNGNSNGVDNNGAGDMVADGAPKQLCGGNPVAIERMMVFGQQLLKLSKEIKSDATAKNKRILKDAFSLLAYKDPWSCPVGYQLDPVQREPVCASLNSAILESQNLPKRPPLLTVVGQTRQCVKKMLTNKIGAAAFINVMDFLR